MPHGSSNFGTRQAIYSKYLEIRYMNVLEYDADAINRDWCPILDAGVKMLARTISLHLKLGWYYQIPYASNKFKSPNLFLK